MKKFFIPILLIAASMAAFSQDGDLKKQFYFRLGPSIPTWKYIGFDDKEDWNGEVKRIGGIFELGNIFMLNRIKLAPNMRIGINADYLSMNSHIISFKDFDSKSSFVFIGSKVGPSFSYSPVDKLVIDAYFKLNPVWASFYLYTSENIDYDEDEIFIGIMAMKYSIGFNVRYSIAMLGFEFNPGSVKMKYYDQDANEITDNYFGNVENNDDKTPAPGFNFTIGLSF
jgi:hypothetical protein